MKCPKCHFENPADTLFCGKCGTKLIPSEKISAPPTETIQTPKEELTTGSTFAGRYQIIEELGKGGMGKVYKVLDKEIKEKVALKLLNPEIASDEKTIERFRNELKFARTIAHKNVCRMYDLSKEEGTHYITMEYVRGEDLKSMIGMIGQLSAGKAIFVAKQVCEGLAEAHRLGVVHRDLKPQNIMIDREGNARIMDFGIARSLKAKGITRAGVMIGTPEYMSPEQAEVKEVDQRSDIYSLGVILYEMVTGRVPFEGETPLSIAMKHKSEAPRDPKELNAQIPEDLSHVILRCMEKDKEKRYQTAEEVLSELTRIEKGIPTTEKVIPKRKPITSKEITVQFSLKKLYIPALVVLALIIAGVIIWRFIPKKEVVSAPSDKPSIAVLPFSDLSPQKDQEFFCDGMTEDIIAKLTKLKGLKVISGDSVMRYKNIDKSIQKIGQELDVDAILHGSVQKANNNIRVIAKLTNVEDGSYLWADTFTKPLINVFNIQSDVALKIGKALEAKYSFEDTERIEKKPTENIEAYNLYLRGRFFWKKRGRKNVSKSVEYFKQAIEKDPSFALAYAGLADSYISLTWGKTLKESLKVKEATLKALELDNTLAEARTSLALFKLEYEWDFKGAKQEFEQAIALNPGYATAHNWYSRYFWWMGQVDEAIAELKLAQELDPLSPTVNRNLGGFYSSKGQYDQAIEEFNKVIEIDPNFINLHLGLGMHYLRKSMFAEAIEEFKKEYGPSSLAGEYWMQLARAKMGEKDQVREWIEEIEERNSSDYPFLIALIWAELGEAGKVFYWLEKAYKNRDVSMIELQLTPSLDNYRSDPRYDKLLKKMGLE